MKHKIQRRRFDMPTSQRMAMLRNLTTDVLKYGYVKTTEARAKELRRLVERMITLGKKDDYLAKKKAAGFIYDKKSIIDNNLNKSGKEISKEASVIWNNMTCVVIQIYIKKARIFNYIDLASKKYSTLFKYSHKIISYLVKCSSSRGFKISSH